LVIDSIKYLGRYKLLRKRVGLSRERVAEDLGYPASTLANWEDGKTSPNVDCVWDVADYYGVTVDYLIGRTDDEKYFKERKVLLSRANGR